MRLLTWLMGDPPPETAAQEFHRIQQLANVSNSDSPGGEAAGPTVPGSGNAESLGIELGAFLAGQADQLIAHHASAEGLGSRAARLIGLEIFDDSGHSGMARVFRHIRTACGPDAAQLLSKNWNQIGNWRG